MPVKDEGHWLWRHRRRVAAVLGLVVQLALCPQLPAGWQGVCRATSDALRTFTLAGLPLDGGEVALPAPVVLPGDFTSSWRGAPYP